MIYKIFTRQQWRDFQRDQVFDGAPVDRKDGFIHFSAAAQVLETASKHFSGQEGLVVAEVDEQTLGEDIRWEVSRGGQLFPHLYAKLHLSNVLSTKELRDFETRG